MTRFKRTVLRLVIRRLHAEGRMGELLQVWMGKVNPPEGTPR